MSKNITFFLSDQFKSNYFYMLRFIYFKCFSLQKYNVVLNYIHAATGNNLYSSNKECLFDTCNCVLRASPWLMFVQNHTQTSASTQTRPWEPILNMCRQTNPTHSNQETTLCNKHNQINNSAEVNLNWTVKDFLIFCKTQTLMFKKSYFIKYNCNKNLL